MKNLKNQVLIFLSIVLVSISPPLASAETINHTYDDLNRLIRSEYSDGTIIIYDYDKLGNRILKKKLYKPHTLTVSSTGEGTGTITSAPARINCGSACSESFSEGTPIALTAVPDPSSVFIQWSGGGCSGTAPCVLTLTADTIVSALFQSCAGAPVKVDSTYYSSLQAAYDAALDGAVIMTQEVTLVENLNANRSISVTISGGYNCEYTVKTGETTLNGSLTSSMGRITISDFRLQ